MSQIDDYLKQVVVRNGSDLHFIAGEPPRARIYGELQILAPETLTASKVEAERLLKASRTRWLGLAVDWAAAVTVAVSVRASARAAPVCFRARGRCSWEGAARCSVVRVS